MADTPTRPRPSSFVPAEDILVPVPITIAPEAELFRAGHAGSLAASEDRVEALRAFVKKRPAVCEGR
jgi:hypothetical protein